MEEHQPWVEPPVWGSHAGEEPPHFPRSEGWPDPVFTTVYMPDSYKMTTEGAVHFLPVVKEGRVLGYLWASVSGDAAMWLDRRGAGTAGFNAGVPWIRRLREAKAEGLDALEAIRKWVGAPEDARAGAIPADAVERELPSLQALKELAAGD